MNVGGDVPSGTEGERPERTEKVIKEGVEAEDDSKLRGGKFSAFPGGGGRLGSTNWNLRGGSSSGAEGRGEEPDFHQEMKKN